MAGGEVAAVLLKEAQQEIALLRTDLFNSRRLAEERRQAIETLQSERERLIRHCEDVEASLRTANAQLNHVPELQHRCAQLDVSLRKLQSELETSIAARRILEQELDDERRHRTALTEQKALLEGERARLAKQRDDLAAQLRVEQRKAREAEEEQVRAEEDAAALRAEVSALQQAAVAVAPTPSSGPSAPAGLTHSLSAASLAASTGASAADTAAAIAASVAAATTPLLEQLEHERNRATALLGSLHAAKSEIMELTQRLSDYEARHTDMLARGHQDPERLAHQLTQLREHSTLLAAQLAASEDRARALETEVTQLQSAAAAVPRSHAAAAAALSQPQAGAAPSFGGSADHHPNQQQPPQQPTDPASAASRLLGAAGRITSSGSLHGGSAAGAGEAGHGHGADEHAAAGTAAVAEDVLRLRQQVARLKASRDKLLAEIDKQWGEIERLSTENVSLADELRAQRTLAANWERQAQDGIAQVDQLKDMLEDSAKWGPGLGLAAGGQAGALPLMPTSAAAVGAAAGGAGDTAAAPQAAVLVQQLQQELLGEKARAMDLELQLRALAAELLRCQHSSLDLGKSFLPMMAGVEKRLSELCRKARNT